MPGPRTVNVMPNARGTNFNDFANFSTVGGNQISNHHSGSGTQNNNNATGTQNINYGRDQNLNNGTGAMTVNNKGGWAPRSAPYTPPSNFPGFGGYSNNNQGDGRQNVNAGRDQNANNSNGDFTINNDERSGSPPPTRGSTREREGREPPAPALSPRASAVMPNPRPSSGKPLSPAKLAQRERKFKEMIDDQEYYDDITSLDGEEARKALNNWQLMSECTQDTNLRTQVLRAMLTLSENSGESPDCLRIGPVESLSKTPVEYGGFADTYTGEIDGTKVAVKVVRHKLHSQKHEQIINAFVREAIVWRNLNHPNILPFTGMYWFDEEQGQLCLVSPWMENGNLLQFLKDHPEVDNATQIRLAKDVAEGLEYLHNLQITHGDLKGYNVLITAERTACITDFGIARVIDGQRLTGLSSMSGRHGQARWLAPEIFTVGRRSAISLESDVYAFGCVCYEIYAKHIPFEDLEEYGIYHRVIAQNGRPDRPPQMPDGVWRLVETCWRASPGSRPKAKEVLEQIGHIQAGRTGGSNNSFRRNTPANSARARAYLEDD